MKVARKMTKLRSANFNNMTWLDRFVTQHCKLHTVTQPINSFNFTFVYLVTKSPSTVLLTKNIKTHKHTSLPSLHMTAWRTALWQALRDTGDLHFAFALSYYETNITVRISMLWSSKRQFTISSTRKMNSRHLTTSMSMVPDSRQQP